LLGRTRTGESLSPRQCPAEDYDDRGPSRASMIRLASATISSVRLFSRLEGLSANGRVDPGAKIAALQPFPTGLTSIRCPLYSIAVIRRRQCASSRFGPVPVAHHHDVATKRDAFAGARRLYADAGISRDRGSADPASRARLVNRARLRLQVGTGRRIPKKMALVHINRGGYDTTLPPLLALCTANEAAATMEAGPGAETFVSANGSDLSKSPVAVECLRPCDRRGARAL